MTAQPRISDFWLDPSRTIERDDLWADEARVTYRYGVARVAGRLTVFRFRSGADRDLWVAQGEGKREKLPWSHKLVQEAKAADDWPDEDEEG